MQRSVLDGVVPEVQKAKPGPKQGLGNSDRSNPIVWFGVYGLEDKVQGFHGAA